MAVVRKKQEGLSKRASGSLFKSEQILTIGALEAALLTDFPLADAEEWDRTGLTVGDRACMVNAVAVALDPTVEAVSEAASCGANVLVTHHPAFLKSPSSFSPASSVALNPGAGVWAAIKSNIALLSYHTSLDVSLRAARVLPGLLSLTFKGQPLVPLTSSRRKGYGQICSIRAEDESLTLERLAARCTAVFGRAPRVWGNFAREIKSVVTCTGSAGEVARECLREQVDCLICGEVKYHDALELSQAGLAIIDLGHDTSELPLVAVLADAVERAGVPKEHITIIDQGNNWSLPETIRV